MSIPTTTSYAGRQVDIELLQSIVVPTNIQRVSISTVSQIPKIVAGIEKVIQRYANLLLTTNDDVAFALDEGGSLVTALLQGTIPSSGYLTHLFNVASNAAIKQMAVDDADTTYGDQPADEIITAATLQSTAVDYASGTVVLNVLIQTAKGLSYTFVVPVTTAG